MRLAVVPSIFVASLAFVAHFTVGCGSSSNSNPGTSDDGGGTATGDDAGATGDDGATADANTADTAPPVGYPAPHAPLPQVDYNGGGVMTGVKIVSVTFDSDTLRSTFESFGDTITTTPWWDAVREGYCAGNTTDCIPKGTAATHPHVHMPTLPIGTGANGALTDSAQGGQSDIQTWIKAQFAAGDAGTPTFQDVDEQTLYVIYFPQGTTVLLDGAQSCANGGFGAYHNSVVIGNVVIPYAIVPHCSGEWSGETVDQTATLSASHEIIEAATDPFASTNQQIGYYLSNQRDEAWSLLGGEVGDLCALDFGLLIGTNGGPANYATMESGFQVQRSWSNTSAKASHNPCVPIPQGGVDFSVWLGPATSPATTTSIAVGSSATIELDAFSDAQADDWTVQFFDFAELERATPVLTFKADKSKVNNGDKINLTISLTGTPAFANGRFEPYVIVSSHGKDTHHWPALIQKK